MKTLSSLYVDGNENTTRADHQTQWLQLLQIINGSVYEETNTPQKMESQTNIFTKHNKHNDTAVCQN